MGFDITIVHLYILQGTTYLHDFIYKDADTDEVIDLTNYTARMQIRETQPSAATLYEGTTDDDITIDGAAGKVSLEIPAATTAAWTWVRGSYDLEVVSAAGRVFRIAEGTVRVKPEVTR